MERYNSAGTICGILINYSIASRSSRFYQGHAYINFMRNSGNKGKESVLMF